MISPTLISLSILLTLTASVTAQQPDLVIELFRHGARAPLSTKFDPNPTYWRGSIGAGELTPAGMRQHYILGSAMRNQYPSLLASYDPNKMYIRSTDYHRTIMSGYSHMDGVYQDSGPNLGSAPASTAIPPYSNAYTASLVTSLGQGAALPNNLQVVPIHVVPTSQDQLLTPYNNCTMGGNWYSANVASSEAMEIFENDLNEIKTYLTSQNVQINTFMDLSLVGDNAIANAVQGVPLPGNIDPSTQPQYYKDLEFATQWLTTNAYVGSETQISLYSLDLLNTISGYMSGVMSGSSELEFVFLSAHDTTMLPLLAAFNITTKDCLLANYRSDKAGGPIPYENCMYPGFASNIIFELYNTAEPYVMFYYNGIAVPICGNANNTCTFSQFESYITQVTNGYTQQNFTEMCQLSGTSSQGASNTQNIQNTEDDLTKYKIEVIIVSVIAFILSVSSSVIVYGLIKKTKRINQMKERVRSQPLQTIELSVDR